MYKVFRISINCLSVLGWCIHVCCLTTPLCDIIPQCKNKAMKSLQFTFMPISLIILLPVASSVSWRTENIGDRFSFVLLYTFVFFYTLFLVGDSIYLLVLPSGPEALQRGVENRKSIHKIQALFCS